MHVVVVVVLVPADESKLVDGQLVEAADVELHLDQVDVVELAVVLDGPGDLSLVALLLARILAPLALRLELLVASPSTGACCLARRRH